MYKIFAEILSRLPSLRFCSNMMNDVNMLLQLTNAFKCLFLYQFEEYE